MAICFIYFLLGLVLFHLQFIRGTDKGKWKRGEIQNFSNDTEETTSSDSKSANRPIKKRKERSLRELTRALDLSGNQKTLLPEDEGTNTEESSQDGLQSSSSNSKSTNESHGKQANRALYEIQYDLYQPLAIDLTENLKTLIAEKEDILMSKGDVHKWKDFDILPLQKNREHWNNLCCQLWPALPGYDKVHKTLARCVASFHSLQTENFRNNRESHYKAYLHDFIRGAEGWSFKADFLSCKCKYMTHPTGKRAIAHTLRYFFAMKLSKNEYFILGHVDPAHKMAAGFKIIGFQSVYKV